MGQNQVIAATSITNVTTLLCVIHMMSLHHFNMLKRLTVDTLVPHWTLRSLCLHPVLVSPNQAVLIFDIAVVFSEDKLVLLQFVYMIIEPRSEDQQGEGL